MISWCIRELTRITGIVIDHDRIKTLTETELAQAHEDADKLVHALNTEMKRRLRKLKQGGVVKA